MAALDLEEQEQLAELKAWWGKHGNLIITIVIAVLLVIAAFNGWRYYQRTQAGEAGTIFEQMQTVGAARDKVKSQELAALLEERFPRTTFAPLAALINAKVQIEAGDAKAAKAQLQWVVDNSKDDELKHIGRVRLAGVLLDEKAYDGALKLLEAARPPYFDPLYLDRKGDVLMAQGKTTEARAVWEDAYAKAGDKNPQRQVLQLKLELVGGSVPEKPKS